MPFLYVFVVLFHFVCASDVPIIGILSQRSFSVDHLFPDDDYHSFIAASYVKFVESAGARVVPIMIGRDLNYYKGIVDHTNGVLFPGGATFFNETGGYAEAGQMIYDYAVEVNENGGYYPIWGTCLGMELLVYVVLQGKEIRSDCSAFKISLPLDFKQDFKTSKMFSNSSQEIIEILSKQNITYNYHRYCLTEDSFREFGLLEDWRVISTNKDVNNFEFISSFESKKYPFYAVQFHPEKSRFEFRGEISHSVGAVKMSQFFANFFVEETRRNDHSFADWLDEQEALIYNYEPIFSGLKNSSYLQLYMFKRDVENIDVLKI